jgi:tetratricopeptide (TPR) repeat protein
LEKAEVCTSCGNQILNISEASSDEEISPSKISNLEDCCSDDLVKRTAKMKKRASVREKLLVALLLLLVGTQIIFAALGEKALGQGEYEKAIEYLQWTIFGTVNLNLANELINDDEEYTWGLLSYENGDYLSAINAMQGVSNSYPYHADAMKVLLDAKSKLALEYLNLAKDNFSSGKYIEANRLLVASLQMNPNLDESLNLKDAYNFEAEKAKSEESERIKAELEARLKAEAGIEQKIKDEEEARIKKEIEAEAAIKKTKGVIIGMNQEDVLASSWGKPQGIQKTVTAERVQEVWSYGFYNHLYFVDGFLVRIDTSQ